MNEILKDLFSHNRMLSYNDYDEYVANITYSMKLYPKFHFFEIALRNKIDAFMKKFLQKKRFQNVHKLNNKLTNSASITEVDVQGFLNTINKYSIFESFSNSFKHMNVSNCQTYQPKINTMLTHKDIIKALESNWLLEIYNDIHDLTFDNNRIDDIFAAAKRSKKTNIIHEDILSNLSMGFWTSMFNSKFIAENEINANIYFRNIFGRTELKTIRDEINYIKECRNRVSHFEKVLKSGCHTNQILDVALDKYLKDLDRSKNLFQLVPNFTIVKI